MSAYAESNNNAGLMLLLIMLAAAFIIAIYSLPTDNYTLYHSGEYCQCQECKITVPCSDLVRGKCAACRWLEQHRGGSHARH